MYDMDGFQVANPIGRFAISSHADLQYGQDGSLEILLQHSKPHDDETANWLPAPKGPFQIMLRLFSPKPEALRGDWTPPTIERLD